MIQPTKQSAYPTGGANAVNINIFDPKAYAGNAPAAPTVQAPYTYEQPIYSMPYMPMYPTMNMPEMAPAADSYKNFMPINNINTAPATQPQFVAPTPSAMPESVLAVAPAAVEAQTQQAPAAAEQQAPQAVAPAPVEVVEPQAQTPVIDVDTLVQNLKSADANLKIDTINQIAAYAQEAPEIALQVVSEPVMQALVDVINEDTTSLQGPTAEQIAVAEKIAKGEQLTPEEDKLSEELSPRDLANKNRIFALYTLAMIQKLQRDELNQYIETQKANGQEAIAPLNVQDLIGYNDVVNVIKNDARPEVKVAAIQALDHVVEPQDKATVETVLADSINSQDEAIKAAATEALAKFAA